MILNDIYQISLSSIYIGLALDTPWPPISSADPNPPSAPFWRLKMTPTSLNSARSTPRDTHGKVTTGTMGSGAAMVMAGGGLPSGYD